MLAGFTLTSAHAGTTGVPYQPSWHWVGAISAGPVWAKAGDSQTFYLTPEIERAYVADEPTNILADAELFLGVQRNLNPLISAQLGVAVAGTSDNKMSGVIWDDADPLFDNYTYTYKVQHTHVAAKAKVLVDVGFWVIPWISGSAGVGFNNAHNFTNTPTIFEAVASPNFASHMTTAFTYTAGAGIQKALNEHWQVGAGYEFADWGKSNLGPASGQTLNTGLKLNHLYTNGVMFNLTYVS